MTGHVSGFRAGGARGDTQSLARLRLESVPMDKPETRNPKADAVLMYQDDPDVRGTRYPKLGTRNLILEA